MGIVAWQTHYELGVAGMDRQHRSLLDHVNYLYESIWSGEGPALVEEKLTHLIEETKNHFLYEEKLLTSGEYPELEKHIDEHRRLMSDLTAKIEKFRKGEGVIGIELTTFIGHWLFDHIDHHDRPVADYIKGKRH